MPIFKVDDLVPSIHPSVYIAEGATVIGNARLAERVSLWTGAVVRADNDAIRIDAGSNIQENAVLHADLGFPTHVGENVTIGHLAMLHGCTIEDGALVGIGAVVLNGAVIGRNSLVGAGSLVTEGKTFPENSLIVGSPARAIRTVTPELLAIMRRDTADYVERSRRYARTLARVDRDGLEWNDG